MAIIIKKKAKVEAPEPVVEPPKPKKKLVLRKPAPQAPVEEPPELVVRFPRKKTPTNKIMDGMCRAAIKSAPMSIVPWWLMASYLYYVHDLSMLSDGLYDELAKDMLKRWDDIKHPHKRLITKDALQAGSLYTLKEEDYPLMTRCAARHLVQHEWGMNIDVQVAA